MAGQLVSAGLAKLLWAVAEQHGIPRSELAAAAALDDAELRHPDALIPRAAADGLLRALMNRTGDPALGLQLARAYDLRAMGFWGYALLSSLTLRQRLQLHIHYHRLINPAGRLSFSIQGDRATVDFQAPDVAVDLMPVLMDFAMTLSCVQFGKHVASAVPDVELWLPYAERPHHRELRALVTGPVVFDAPHLRFRFAAKELDRRLAGDPHLLELAKTQLDAQLAKLSTVWNGDVVAAVRQRLVARLAEDASIERIARDLQVSARTLRRQLSDFGASFQQLLEETRLAHAVSDLLDTNHAIKQVAARLGYRDPSNFRRAFRRWTGRAPADYRAEHRARRDERPVSVNDGFRPEMPLPLRDD